MRIQPTHTDARMLKAEPTAQCFAHQVDRCEYITYGEMITQLKKRFVNAGQCDAKPAAGEHHGHSARLERMSELFRVTGITKAGRAPTLFADWRRHNSFQYVGSCRRDGHIQKPHRGVAALHRWVADGRAEHGELVEIGHDHAA